MVSKCLTDNSNNNNFIITIWYHELKLIINYTMALYLDNVQKTFLMIFDKNCSSSEKMFLHSLWRHITILRLSRARCWVLIFNSCHRFFIGFKSGFIDGYGSSVIRLFESRYLYSLASTLDSWF